MLAVKKPVEVEVEQFIIWDFARVPKTVDIFGVTYEVKGENFNRYIEIHTDAGVMKAKHLDYIIKGVHGEVYTCDSELFRKTYKIVG